MKLNGSKFKEISMIQEKLWEALAEFQIMHFMKCFKWWQNP
jgi:hypothetical protein